MDRSIRRNLKAWVGQTRLPAGGRTLLMQAAAAQAFAPVWAGTRRRQARRLHRREPSEWSFGWSRQTIAFWMMADVERLYFRC